MLKMKFLFVSILAGLCSVQFSPAQEKFSFAFLTDIHMNVNPVSRSVEGFKQAVSHAEGSGADFILTGGDNVDVDGIKHDQREIAFQLYRDYKAITDAARLPFHYTIGNHDRYWADGQESELAGSGLFQSQFGDSYYSFEYKGWLFIVLNSVQICDGKYCVGDAQKKWLADLLAATPTSQPIIVSTHVPFLSLYYPVLEGRYTDADTFVNQKEIFDMFADHKLKLVLQGHQHLYEEIKVKGVQFITAGAVSANWWSGAFHGTEEGYLKVTTDGDDFSWEYVDYGWEVKR
ncbi:metallophosphoesterase family protein [Parapedobacter koreensis]|uniref:Calcineurin-like phosphoesterase n=1 Tax=Parapedobacter koreensis TaxID=332977 RepID=A0A1H7EW48_9SPHI|nr:metallophosphoesterase [Parapedobacter koreensis]SEK18081.1 Calcineurin-like phosphoesterase [Parapedobacter koreensis]